MVTPGEKPESEEGSGVAVEEKAAVAEPPRYAVVLHNDDYTTMEFVIEVLKKFFKKTDEEAYVVTMQVHNMGQGVAGIYSQDIAETKVLQVTEYSKKNGHPLRATVEEA